MNLKKLIVGIMLLAISGGAFAGSSYTGHVKVHCNDSTGQCNIYIFSAASGVPACAGNPSWYVFNMSSILWKQQFAVAMLAQATQKNVNITGAGTCNIRPGTHEDLEGITLEDS